MPAARTIVPIAWALGCGPAVLALLQLPGAAWWAMFGYHAGCLAAVWSAGGPGPRLHQRWRLGLGVGVLSLAVVLVTGALVRALGLLPVGEIPRWSRWGLRPPIDLVWLALYVTVNPWVEERFWRGALLTPPFRAQVGRRTSLALAILAFGVHHAVVLGASLGWVRGALFVLPVVAAGALWTAIRLRSGGIAPAVASHRGADLALALLYCWQWRS